MAAFTPSAQRVPVGPGTLYAAPLGTSEPTSVTGAWPSGWQAIGYTDKGNDRSYKPTYQAVEVDEELEPIRYVPSMREITVSFSIAEITVVNALLALNAGIGTSQLTDVTGNDGLGTDWVEPPDLGEEVRVMLGWDAAAEGATPKSTDSYLGRSIYRQCLQTGEIKSTHQKGNNKYLYTVTFSLEKPSGKRAFRDLFPSGVAS